MKVPLEIIPPNKESNYYVVQIAGSECWLNCFGIKQKAEVYVNDLVETGYFEGRQTE